MNNDLYYKKKYLKYKTKYIKEKVKIEGGSIFGNSCESNNLLIQLKTKINPLQYLQALIELVKTGTTQTIIDMAYKIYMEAVFAILKLNKGCLAPELNRYLVDNQQELNEYTVLEFPVKQSTSFPVKQSTSFPVKQSTSFPKLTFTSLNINEQKNKGVVEFVPEIKNDDSFTKGTAFISGFVKKGSSDEFKRNLRYLSNLMNIKFSIAADKFVESLRFGTPYAPSGSTNFYDEQIKILKKYVGKKKKCVLVSFLDPCDSVVCALAGEKGQEDIIIRLEIKEYLQQNFVYLNMSCNNGVNLTGSIAGISDQVLKDLIGAHLNTLEKWISDSQLDCNIQEILEKLKNNDKFFEKLKKYVSDKNNTDQDLQKKLQIRKFVLRKKPKEASQLLNFEDNMKQFSPCEEDLTNEHIGLVMFCYVSLIFYLLSRTRPNEFILLYHCKSGQDRTGTFFAINQMVNQITTENYEAIIAKILKGTSFIDIFFEYYSLTTKNENIPPELKFCPDISKTTLQENKSKINEKVELCYSRYLLFSYFMTLTSTGIPGIKWGLTNTSLPMRLFNKRKYDTDGAIDNRFGYLLTRKPENVLLFEGGSQQRGA